MATSDDHAPITNSARIPGGATSRSATRSPRASATPSPTVARRPPRLGRPRRRGALAGQADDFAYANLAVRGKLIAADRRRAGRAGARAASPTSSRSRRAATTSSGPAPTPTRSRRSSRTPSCGCAATARRSSSSRASTSASRRCSAASAARSRSTTRTSARSPSGTTASSPTSGRSTRCRTRASGRPDRLHLTRSATTRSPAWCCAPSTSTNDLEPMKPEPLPARHLAAGARRGPRLGARVPRAVGAAAHPPPVVGRPRHGEATRRRRPTSRRRTELRSRRRARRDS